MNGLLRLHDLDDEEDDRRPASRGEEHFAGADIDAGLGRVHVDEAGDLVAVDLDERALRAMNPAALGGHLLAAIERAEQAARTERVERRKR
ncbi:hypothetical protein [Amycolatopsis sp. EV170708-02-1]|uniref:hypothetical protein n=1 Tax=Amycolatopsis sp. EV170708-02-1 TaxID=2919322 RepID=UPI001F0BAC1D|nr:hypothetical protein [Amycolatopsis sp. EV170708-02-1]UMP06188.1 hypothetical protein MJQ72_15860 [Amycolatopsis sp. EV170708-02-1]